MTNTAVASQTTFAPLIKGRDTIAPDLRESLLYRTISIVYTRNYCDGLDYDRPLGACGCYDYHYADCPTRG